MSQPSSEEVVAVTAEALRRNDRYVLEVVEGRNVCPFARGARVSGRAVREVLLLERCDEVAVADAIARYEAGDAGVEVVQLIFPRLAVAPRLFEDFVGRVRTERALRPGPCPFALAGFHPDFALDLRTADTAVAFFRRAPDPTIQLVRLTAIDEITRHDPTPAELIERFHRGEPPPPPPIQARITRDNYERVRHDGAAVVGALLDAIARDRR